MAQPAYAAVGLYGPYLSMNADGICARVEIGEALKGAEGEDPFG